MVKWAGLLKMNFNLSNLCCNTMKKTPCKQFEKETNKYPIIATMAEESRNRKQSWFKSGCNAFNNKRPTSQPMSFWTEQDVLEYIYKYQLPICSVYGDVIFDEKYNKYKTTKRNRTGCIFCGFGCHLEKSPTRFELLKESHPKQYNYCLNGGAFDEDGLWKPNKQGLGMKYIFDKLNELYGEDFIKY